MDGAREVARGDAPDVRRQRHAPARAIPRLGLEDRDAGLDRDLAAGVGSKSPREDRLEGAFARLEEALTVQDRQFVPEDRPGGPANQRQVQVVGELEDVGVGLALCALAREDEGDVVEPIAQRVHQRRAQREGGFPSLDAAGGQLEFRVIERRQKQRRCAADRVEVRRADAQGGAFDHREGGADRADHRTDRQDDGGVIRARDPRDGERDGERATRHPGRHTSCVSPPMSVLTSHEYPVLRHSVSLVQHDRAHTLYPRVVSRMQ